MATSGIVTFQVTRDDLINAALRLCSAIDPETASGVGSAAQIINGAQALNMMVKGWEAEGLQLWERKYGVVFFQKSQAVYVLGSPGPSGDHATLSTPLGTGYVKTTLTASAAAAATSIVVTSTSNTGTVGTPAITIASTWFIGIQQTDGTLFWTTVSGAPAGNTITLVSGLSVGANNGAVVWSYQTKLIKPLRLLDGFTRQSAGNDIPCRIISRDEYNRFGMKTSTGTPIQLYHDPQENTSHLYIYPTPQDVTQVVFIEFQKPIEDIASSADNADLPQEWLEAIKYNLAVRIAPEYSVPEKKYKQLKELAAATFQRLDGWDQEFASVYIQPNRDMRGNG